MAFVLYLLYLCGIIKKMFSEVLLLIFTQNLESNNGECFNYGRKRFYRKFHRRGSEGLVCGQGFVLRAVRNI